MDTPVKEFVQQTISERRSARQQKYIGPEHAVWNVFSPQHYTLLKDLIQSPLTFAPDAHPDVLELVDPATRYEEQPTIYLRVCTADVETMRASIESYCKMYPADKSWCTTVMKHITALFSHDNPTTLHYCGMSFHSTAYERSQKDVQRAAEGGSRILDWLRTNHELVWDVYQLQGLGFDNSLSLVDYGFIQDFIIKAIGDTAMNSANGGYYVDYQPSRAICQLWENTAPSVDLARYLQQTPVSDFIKDALRKHFEGYSKFMERVTTQGMTSMVAPTEELVQAVNDQAQPKAAINGTTVSVIISEHTPSSSAHFFRETLEFLSSLSGNISVDLLFPAFVNLLAMHRQQPLFPSTLFLSRYLTIVRPVVIVSMSQAIFTHFHLDTFRTIWLDTSSTTAFFQEYRSPDVHGGLSEIAKMEPTPCTAFFKSSTAHLTNVAIVAYGPGDTDYALLLPIRNLGSLNYGPAIQALKAEEVTLSICAMHILESLVRRRLANGEQRPTDHERLFGWLKSIQMEFDDVMETTGMKQHIQHIKDKIVRAEKEHMSMRMIASKKRRRDDMNTSDERKLVRIKQPFIGDIHSMERQQQYNQLKEQDSWRRERGLVFSRVPCPPAMIPFSSEHQAWFLGARAGAVMQRVAVATGNNPMSGLNEDEKEDYLRKRRFGVYGDRADREKNAIQRLQDMAQKIGNVDEWMTIDKLPIRATCSTCGHTFIKLPNTTHYCDPQELTSQEHGLHYFRLLYLHDIVDAWMDTDMEELLKLDQHDAATILNKHQHQGKGDRIPGSLGMIYTLPTHDTATL